MKNYRRTSLASRNKKLSHKLNGFRAMLIVASVALLAGIPFYVFAQDNPVAVSPKAAANYRPDPDRAAFVITVGPDGKTICRQATPEEARAMSAGSGKPELRQINHLKTGGTDQADSSTATGLTIILRATAQLDANPAAKQAFISAAAKWEALIKDRITINIDVDFGTSFFGTPFPGPTVLGQTESQLLYISGNYPDIRQRLLNRATGSEGAVYNVLPNTSIPTDIGSVDTVLLSSPLLRTFALLSTVADDSEEPQIGAAPRIGFNSGFGFDFDPNNGITFNLTDFDAVAVHEMGHVLGFNSLVGDRELDPMNPLALSVWDMFRFRPGTANIDSFSTAQRILSSGGIQVQFNGGPELGLSTAKPDGTGGDGNQASHWKADELSGVFIGIMDPTISRGTRETLQANDQTAMDSFGYTLSATTPPPNDNFVNAQVIPGTLGTISATNDFATKETGEPTHEPLGNIGGKSVWYRWAAPASGSVTLTTSGSNFDTLLAVYTGSSVNALTQVVKNDDDPNGGTTSRVTFAAVSGTTYQIAVDGYNADQGNLSLNYTLPGNPGANTVQFTSSTASATETPNATTRIDLQVTRTGTTTSAATVNYATSNVSASDRSDYEAALGTLHFAANETSKIIPLFVVDDAFGELSQTFNITLSNSLGSTIGTPSTVIVTINSNESVNGSNPVKDPTFNNDFFVRQHYLDFFNREPDTGGLNFWKNQLNECEQVPLPGGFATAQECREIRRINVSAAFFLSIEFQQTGYLVERLFKTAYGDAQGTSTLGGTHQLSVPIVRYNEFIADTQEIGSGVVIGQPGADQKLEMNKQTLIAEFVQRPRFISAYPALMTPTQFVETLNTNAGGVLSQAEHDQLINDLTSGTKTRAQVLRAIAEDTDLFNAETNRAFVLVQYFGYLRRNPNDSPDTDYTGYDFWLGKLNQFNGNFVNAEMVKAFIVSGEYQGRFGP